MLQRAERRGFHEIDVIDLERGAAGEHGTHRRADALGVPLAAFQQRLRVTQRFVQKQCLGAFRSVQIGIAR